MLVALPGVVCVISQPGMPARTLKTLGLCFSVQKRTFEQAQLLFGPIRSVLRDFIMVQIL
jgi:hypothetical protein